MNSLTAIFIMVFIYLAAVLFNKRRKAGKSSGGSGVFPSPPLDKSNHPQAAPYKDAPLPGLLGIQAHIPLQPAIARLEQALPEAFITKLRERVLSRYPGMTQAEYNWKLLELKRYFLMTAVLKEVPMFSPAVDELWHELLMFTREYYRLGEALTGSLIHHAPHTGGQADPGGRAWFDWVYAQLFVPTPYSGRIWNSFFRHPLDAERLEELRSYSEDKLAAEWFNKTAMERFPEIRETARALISQAKVQASSPPSNAAYKAERPAYDSSAYMPYMAGALMFYSVSEAGNFDSAMESHYPEEEAERRAQESAGDGPAYTGSDSPDSQDSNHSQNGEHDHGPGEDSGGSNSDCSSSSGCSSSSCSSCGGGGD